MWECEEHHSQPNASGEVYYYSRNIPHPRMVFHMPGLNNAPVCVVRSCFSRECPLAGNAGTPDQKHEQEHVLPEITTKKPTADLPELQSFLQREPGTAQSMTKGRADLPERIPSDSALSGKLLKRRAQASAQCASSQRSQAAPCGQPSSPPVPSHCGPRVQDTQSCLDVMEKLTQILKTDSFAETQQWFARASKEEKDLVSSQIFPNLSDRGESKPNEGTAENSVQAVLKPLPPLQSGPGGLINQSRKEECPLLSNAQQKTSTRRHAAPRKEQLQGKRNGSNRPPRRLPTLPEVSAVPQPFPKPRYPLSCGGRLQRS
ncbi:uncharacterized protein C4orf17 homolog [Porphyrio hochstetteri]